MLLVLWEMLELETTALTHIYNINYDSEVYISIEITDTMLVDVK